jgi:hypothetical protein
MLQLLRAPARNRNVDYLSVGDLPIGIRNDFAFPVLPEKIVLNFEVDHPCTSGYGEFRQSWTKGILNPGANEYENIRVRAKLLFGSSTNPCQITVTFREDQGHGFWATNESTLGDRDHLVIENAPVFQQSGGEPRSVFVSFKDPEDLELAELASELLERAGIEPYLAKTDSRTGSAYWNKIYKAIRNAEGTLVIWTSSAAANRDNVIRELNYSKKHGTSVGLFLQRGVTAPPEYPANKKEFAHFTPPNAAEPLADSITAAVRRLRNGKTFFS